MGLPKYSAILIDNKYFFIPTHLNNYTVGLFFIVSEEFYLPYPILQAFF